MRVSRLIVGLTRHGGSRTDGTFMFAIRNINILYAMPLLTSAEGEPATLNVRMHGRVSSPLPPISHTDQPQGNSTKNAVTTLEPVMEAQYEKVGRIAHFYSKAGVAIVELTAPLNKGAKIIIRGSTTNIEQTVDSMEVEHEQIANAQAGQRVGMKVAGRVRENDIIYRVKAGA